MDRICEEVATDTKSSSASTLGSSGLLSLFTIVLICFGIFFIHKLRENHSDIHSLLYTFADILFQNYSLFYNLPIPIFR